MFRYFFFLICRKQRRAMKEERTCTVAVRCRSDLSWQKTAREENVSERLKVSNTYTFSLNISIKILICFQQEQTEKRQAERSV